MTTVNLPRSEAQRAAAWASVLLMLTLGLATVWPAAVAAADGPAPGIRVSDLMALHSRLGAPEAVGGSFGIARELGGGGVALRAEDVMAFEEHAQFVYLLAEGPADAVGKGAAGDAADKPAPRWIRGLVFCKPDVFVVFDIVFSPTSDAPIRWRLGAEHQPAIDGRRACVVAGDGELYCETLLPEEATLKTVGPTDDAEESPKYALEVSPKSDGLAVGFLHVLHLRQGDQAGFPAKAELSEKDGRRELTVTTAERVFRLTAPSRTVPSGRIEIVGADGKTLLPSRFLAAGILPHGPQGVRMLAGWDSTYHDDRRPAWDIGRPATDLIKAVEDGTVKPGRAVVLGCGTGTNAIYLASKGFDVTGIDLAPTALARAEAKAEKAGATVRWLVADVTAPPKLEPFDFIFDRGCYHGVRRGNAAGYVEAAGKLTHKGSQILILAGNANEERHYGPPRVKEEEIRGDFAEGFDFQWLRETHFDGSEPGQTNALAWSILLRRKE